MSVLEATSAPASSDGEWANRVLDATAPIFRADPDCVFVSHVGVTHAPDGSWIKPLYVVGELAPESLSGAETLISSRSRVDWIRALFYPPTLVSTHSEVESTLEPEMARRLRAWDAQTGIADGLGVLVHPEPGKVAVLSAGLGRRKRLSRLERAALTRIGLHLEAGWRLRLHPERVLAVLDPTGEVIHLEEGAPAKLELQHRVRTVERARTRRARTEVESLDVWEALIAGRASLVERSDGGRRRYYVVENPPSSQPLRAFTRGEVHVVSYASRGLTAKLVGYALGIGDAAVSHRLASAAAKMGVASRMEAVRIAAMLVRDPRAHFDEGVLTAAERDVLELVDQGLSNEAIARLRSRSVRTIANQVAALLRKTGVASRRALVALRHRSRDAGLD